MIKNIETSVDTHSVSVSTKGGVALKFRFDIVNPSNVIKLKNMYL